MHSSASESTDIIRLLKYAACSLEDDSTPSVPQTAHTDLGSLTMLFANTPGLQILSKNCTDWLYVIPKARHVVVNLGDAMNR